MIRVKRAYESRTATDGVRILVDRLWPRGIKRDALHLESWLKDVAPSDNLRRWFDHDPKKWEEFTRRYGVELDHHPETWQPLAEAATAGTVTLIFGAKDIRYNNAVALKTYLEAKLKKPSRRR